MPFIKFFLLKFSYFIIIFFFIISLFILYNLSKKDFKSSEYTASVIMPVNDEIIYFIKKLRSKKYLDELKVNNICIFDDYTRSALSNLSNLDGSIFPGTNIGILELTSDSRDKSFKALLFSIECTKDYIKKKIDFSQMFIMHIEIEKNISNPIYLELFYSNRGAIIKDMSFVKFTEDSFDIKVDENLKSNKIYYHLFLMDLLLFSIIFLLIRIYKRSRYNSI